MMSCGSSSANMTAIGTVCSAVKPDSDCHGTHGAPRGAFILPSMSGMSLTRSPRPSGTEQPVLAHRLYALLGQCHLAYRSSKALTCMFAHDGQSGRSRRPERICAGQNDKEGLAMLQDPFRLSGIGSWDVP